jgi:Na+-translocating ferredoxin:NAD+ oxidoreductase subunit B
MNMLLLSLLVAEPSVINLSAITIPIAVVGGLGLVFGLVLAFASKVFFVEVDPRVEQIIQALPGANCGACGMPGCAGYADAIVHEDVDINLCAPGGASAMAFIAAIMGREAAPSQKKIAVYHCSSGGYKNTNWKYNYEGITSCKSAVNIADGPNSCRWGCMGFNDCVVACPFGAITVDEFGMRCVDKEKCTGCGACVKACPRGIIILVPENRNVLVRCSSKDKGVTARVLCGSGHPCIGCGLCAKKCPTGAITVSSNLARIDYSKCINCGQCATVCPTKAIEDQLSGKRKKAHIIPEGCIGCTICAKNCPVKAITGEVKQVHVVNQEICIGCGLCAEKCPKKTIEMV